MGSTRRTHLTLLAVTGALLACGPPPDGSRLVLLDEAARVAGALVRLEQWEGSPAFAVRLAPDERPLLISPTDARRLDVPERSLAVVEGADAQVRFLDLDREVARDALVLTGSEGAVKKVAKLLDAEVTPLDGDRYRLTAMEVLDRSAFLDAPRGLREVRPIESGPPELRSILGRGPAPALAWRDPSRAEGVPIALAGIYGNEESTLILDAEGGFTLREGCGGESRTGTAVLSGDQLTLLEDRRTPWIFGLRDDGEPILNGIFGTLRPITEEVADVDLAGLGINRIVGSTRPIKEEVAEP